MASEPVCVCTGTYMFYCRELTFNCVSLQNPVHLDKLVQRSTRKYIQYCNAAYLDFPWYVVLRYILPCTVSVNRCKSALYLDTVEVHPSMYQYVRVCTMSLQFILVCTRMYGYINATYNNFIRYILVYTCMYKYILLHDNFILAHTGMFACVHVQTHTAQF